MAKAGISLRGPLVGEVRLRSGAGRVGFAWRTEGQSDFQEDQVVTKTIEATDQAETVSLEIPAEGEVIHVRLLLPVGTCRIESVALKSQASEKPVHWSFVVR